MTPFEIIALQPRSWGILSRSFTTDRVAGTYLFHGREGLGHWPLALTWAALLNCEGPVELESDPNLRAPCGVCRNCRSVAAINHEGLMIAVPLPKHKNAEEAIDQMNALLDEKRKEPFHLPSAEGGVNIPISVAREIKRSLARKAAPGSMRVALFYRMERMRTDSADALLKLIEEPPPNTVIVLTADRPESLLPTIQSRAQKIRLDRISAVNIRRYLGEHYEVSEKRADQISRLADGSLGRAIDLVRHDPDDDGSRRSVCLLIFKSLFLGGNAETIGHLREMVNLGNLSEVEDMLRLWQSLIRDCNNYSVLGEDDAVVNIDCVADIRKLSTRFTSAGIAASMTEAIKNTLADLRLNVHIPGALAALVIKLRSQIDAA